MSELPSNFSGIDAVFICVGTPCDDKGNTDLRYIFNVLDMLKLDEYNGIIVIKSTTPPSTAKTKIIPYIRKKSITVPVANNPEFMREGYCWNDFMNPGKIVCGVEDPHSETVLKEIYKDFNAPIVFVSLNTAEFIKYLSNNMLANMISFSNEMSMIAHAIGDISIKQAFEAIYMDKRWGNATMTHYLYPGCGFGGYCLPKDLEAMIAHARNHGVEPVLLESVQTVNRSMPSFFAELAISTETDSIGILGLSFKPNSDDVRNSPAAHVISELIKKDKQSIYAYDPVANMAFQKAYSFSVIYCESMDAVCENAKTVIIVTAWEEFKNIDKRYTDVKFIDGRYML